MDSKHRGCRNKALCLMENHKELLCSSKRRVNLRAGSNPTVMPVGQQYNVYSLALAIKNPFTAKFGTIVMQKLEGSNCSVKNR